MKKGGDSMSRESVVEFLKDMLEKKEWEVGYCGEVKKLNEILDEILDNVDSADTIRIDFTERVDTVEVEHFKTSWLARYRKIEYWYIISEKIENVEIHESERLTEYDDFSAIYTYTVSSRYTILIQIEINNFEGDYTKNIWIGIGL